MILSFAGPQNFVISFMDKLPIPILMRWIFGPLGRGNNTPLSGFVYHKFWQNFWLGPPEVAIEQSKGRAEPTQDSSMSKQTTKLLFLEPTALWKLWPQWVTVPFHNNIVIFSDIFVLSLCYYFEHRPWIVWPFFYQLIQTVLFSYYTVSSEQIQEKYYGNGLGQKTRLHWVSNKVLQCSHWNIKP